MHTLYEIYNTIWNIDTKTAILWNSRRLKTVISQISSQGVPMFRFRPTLKGFMLPQISLGMNPITCYVISINSINRHFLNFLRTIGMVWRELSLPSKIYLKQGDLPGWGEKISRKQVASPCFAGHWAHQPGSLAVGNGRDLEMEKWPWKVKGWTTELEFFQVIREKLMDIQNSNIHDMTDDRLIGANILFWIWTKPGTTVAVINNLRSYMKFHHGNQGCGTEMLPQKSNTIT